MTVAAKRSAAIVGGGVAGLVAARELAAHGRRVVLLEATGRVGGALRADCLAGVDVDVGAEAFGVTRPETGRLIEALGLRAEVIAPRRSDAHLLLDDGLFAMPHALLGVPTDLSAASVVAVLGAEHAQSAALLDAARMTEYDPAVTLGDLVRSRMGDAVVDRILTPVVAGVHAADPDLVEADAVVPGLREAAGRQGSLAGGARALRAAGGVPGAAVAGLRGGMTTLVRALADDARARGVDIRTGVHVRSARAAEGRWDVASESAAGAATERFDEVVLCVDAPTAAGLLDGAPEVVAPLSGIRVGDVAVAALVLDAPELDADPVGSGLLIAPGHPRVRAKALTHASAKWEWIRAAYGPGRHLIRLSYGRNGSIDEDPADLPHIVEQDVARIFGLERVAIIDLAITRWDRSLVLPSPGHRQTVRRITSAAAAIPGLVVLGAGLGGNGLAGAIARAEQVVDQLDLPR